MLQAFDSHPLRRSAYKFFLVLLRRTPHNYGIPAYIAGAPLGVCAVLSIQLLAIPATLLEPLPTIVPIALSEQSTIQTHKRRSVIAVFVASLLLHQLLQVVSSKSKLPLVTRPDPDVPILRSYALRLEQVLYRSPLMKRFHVS